MQSLIAPRRTIGLLLPSPDRAWVIPWLPLLLAAEAAEECQILVFRRDGDPPFGQHGWGEVILKAETEADLRRLGATAAPGDVLTIVGPSSVVRQPSSLSESTLVMGRAGWQAWLHALGAKPPMPD